MSDDEEYEVRVNEAGYTNITADGDDADEDLDIYEALIDPHEQNGKGRGGQSGAPMMMPPMMGGGGTAGAGAAGGAAGAAGASRLGAGGGLSAGGIGQSGLASGVPAAGGLGAGGLSSGSPGSGGLGSGAGLGAPGTAGGINLPGSSRAGTGPSGLADDLPPIPGGAIPASPSLGSGPGIAGSGTNSLPSIGSIPGSTTGAGLNASPISGGTSTAGVDPVQTPDIAGLGKGLDGLTNRAAPGLSASTSGVPHLAGTNVAGSNMPGVDLPKAGESGSGIDAVKMPTLDAKSLQDQPGSTAANMSTPDLESVKGSGNLPGGLTDANGDGVPDVQTPGTPGVPDLKADDMAKTPEVPGVPGIDGSGVKGSGVDGSGVQVPGSGVPDIKSGIDTPGAGIPNGTDAATGMPGISGGGGMPGGGGLPGGGGVPDGGGAGGGGASDGFHAEQKDFRTEAKRWDEYSKNYAHQLSLVEGANLSDAQFYGAEEMITGYRNLKRWLSDFYRAGGGEFSIISNKISRAGGKYARTEAENAAAASHQATRTMNADDASLLPPAPPRGDLSIKERNTPN